MHTESIPPFWLLPPGSGGWILTVLLTAATDYVLGEMANQVRSHLGVRLHLYTVHRFIDTPYRLEV